jgi:hypothetical protein
MAFPFFAACSPNFHGSSGSGYFAYSATISSSPSGP